MPDKLPQPKMTIKDARHMAKLVSKMDLSKLSPDEIAIGGALLVVTNKLSENESALVKAADALGFYADTENWTELDSRKVFELNDKGKTAREAIAELRKVFRP